MKECYLKYYNKYSSLNILYIFYILHAFCNLLEFEISQECSNYSDKLFSINSRVVETVLNQWRNFVLLLIS